MALPPAYTVCIYKSGLVPAGPSSIGSPPSGFRWSVVDIVAYNQQPSYLGLQGIRIYDTVGATLFAVDQVLARGSKLYHWSGRQAVDDTDALEVVTFDDLWTLRITGYKLSES